MKKPTLALITFAFFSAVAFLVFKPRPTSRPQPAITEEDKTYPSDWMYQQRAYPNNHIDRQAYADAYRLIRIAKEEAKSRGGGLWQPAGPVNIGGRITDVALHPANQQIIFAGTSVGGIFKSVDGGVSWAPIFDDMPALSIGDIAVAPSSPDVIYVGTGEANGSFATGSFFGDGIFKSTDGGAHWAHVGLERSNHIGRIAVDPQNPDRAYAAAAGVLYGKNEERGLYRTLNGGQDWEKVLYLSDSTACIDVAVNPRNADTVFAATWERIRYPWQRRYGGLTSRVYRSTDGGTTWAQMTNGLPPDDAERGRIGLAVSPSSPNTVYACYTTDAITNVFDGIYKSTDAGNSWARVDDGTIGDVFSSFGWFFTNLRVPPDNANEVWCLGVPLLKSTNGGVAWANASGPMHVDHHALEAHPLNPDFMVAGNDGGIYLSQNRGNTWTHIKTLPITMFYNCEIDFSKPERLYGGTQDNGTMRTLSGNPDDWQVILGGDGFHVIVDPGNNNFVYAEFQFGNLFRSTNGGNSMMFSFGGSFDDRNNWNTPVVMDPSNPAVIYYGSNILYKSTNRGGNWEPVSPDLTDGQHPSGSSSFGTLTTIAVAPSAPQTIYAGTDDGNVQVTFDGGGSWANVSAGLPDRYVTKVAVHPFDPLTAVVTLSGFRVTDYQPHILRTKDGGNSWADVSGNLPEIPINDVVIDPENPGIMYIANDMGVWFTVDAAATWAVLGANFPTTIVNDIVLHPPTKTLVAATFGRSMLKYDVSAIEPPNATVGKVFQNNPLHISPNPLTNSATISFDLPIAAVGKLEIFSLQGKPVSTLATGTFNPGVNTFNWQTAGLPKGSYLVRLQLKDGVWTKKAVKP